jgi:hypothetical protein
MWKICGTAGETTDDNIIRRMRIACWVSKATDIQSEYLILIAIPRQRCVRERAQCYVIRTLSLLLNYLVFNGREEIVLNLPLRPDD